MIDQMIKRNLTETAVYWAVTGKNKYNEKTFATPDEIDCRWEDRVDVVKDSQGKEVRTRARVFVNTNVQEQGYLFRGKKKDLDSADEENPYDATEAYEIKRKERVPAIGSKTKFMTKAYLG